MMNLAVFQGAGTYISFADLKLVEEWISRVYKNCSIIFITNFASVTDSFFNDNCIDVFIVPASNVTGLEITLTTDSITALKKFITKGGTYVGICGGAYFVCSDIIFKGKHRKGLGFIDVTARGPLNHFYSDIPGLSKNDQKISYLDIQYSNVECKIPYCQGPEFIFNDYGSDYNITSRFVNESICSFDCKLGDGTIRLMSVHPEMTSKYWNDNKHISSEVILKMVENINMIEHLNDPRHINNILAFSSFVLNIHADG